MKPLNPIQEQFIRNRLIPFARDLGRQTDFVTDFVKRLEIILEQRQYDEVDKIIIEFLMNKLKENLYETDPS